LHPQLLFGKTRRFSQAQILSPGLPRHLPRYFVHQLLRYEGVFQTVVAYHHYLVRGGSNHGALQGTVDLVNAITGMEGAEGEHGVENSGRC
jgi:hypothetical protein